MPTASAARNERAPRARASRSSLAARVHHSAEPSRDLPAAARNAQSERSRRTRQLVLDAAISCLEELGYAGTTTVAIQRRAGVSRGRLLHHFPSRDRLLLAALSHLAGERFRSLRLAAADRAPGPNALRAAIDLLWMTYEGPLFWAASELWLAARHDPGLRAALQSEERKVGAAVHGVCDMVFGEDVTSRPGYVEFRELLITSMRGVALTYAFNPRAFESDRHRESWYRLAEAYLDRNIFAARAEHEPLIDNRTAGSGPSQSGRPAMAPSPAQHKGVDVCDFSHR